MKVLVRFLSVVVLFFSFIRSEAGTIQRPGVTGLCLSLKPVGPVDGAVTLGGATSRVHPSAKGFFCRNAVIRLRNARAFVSDQCPMIKDLLQESVASSVLLSLWITLEI